MTTASTDALQSAILEARERGWSTFKGELSSIARAERLPGARVIPQANGHPRQLLRPTGQQAGRRRSLSAIHGLDEFPLHTDGAHYTQPPDLILLQCLTSTKTPTHVLPLADIPTAAAAVLVQGIFMVGVGRKAFYSPAISKGRLRYDIDCMRPLDSQARRVVDVVKDVAPAAKRFTWNGSGDILLIDNRTALHGRGSVVGGESLQRELVRVYLREEKA